MSSSSTGIGGAVVGAHGISKPRQFAAVLQKNFILQIRGRRSFLGLGGLPALLLQIALPALFFALMCIPKYYIQPYDHPMYLQQSESDIDTKWWAGATPYEGPAAAAGGKARIAFVPDSPAVASLVRRVAMAVSCPVEAYKRICSSASITTFSCLFGVSTAPPQCQNATLCMTTLECYEPALKDHLLLLKDMAAVEELLQQQPHSLDAVVVFPHAAANQTAGSASPQTAAAAASTASHLHAGASSSRLAVEFTESRGVFHPEGMHAGAAGQKQLLGCGGPAAADGDGLLLDYVIRMNSSDVPPTQLLQDLFDVSPGQMPLPGNLLWEYRRYWFFVNLQLAIDRALLGGQQSSKAYPAPLTVKVKPFPWPRRQEDLGAASAAAFFNLLLVFAFLAPTRATVGSIVREKELRLREGMRILGLSEAAYWWSWSVTHWLTLSASGLLCAVVGLYPFRHSSFSVMLAFYWLFSAALISFSYFLSTLFSASRVAGTATQFLYALSMIPGFLLPFTRPYGDISWYLAGLCPTSAASLFAAALVNWERLAAGVTLDTLWLPVTPDSSFCVGSVMWLLAVDVLLYAALTWYCDKVLPQPHGQRWPFWFPISPLLPASWRGSGQVHSTAHRSAMHAEQQQPLLGAVASADSPAATAGAASNAGRGGSAYVQVRDLRKVFHSAEGSVRVAVEGLTLDMWAGRITALLGHNGAGKTTTIHMLTGMLAPTSGTAYIGGHDIRTHMATIRQSLGICPQFDILWPDITVQEHLRLYAVIKGARWGEADTQAQQAAAEVGLSDKLHCLASELSGGQRRKLSVAIAFLGSPAVVFLDEPTSGMDPYSRRTTWDLIRSRRHQSVIVLTTHSMEEADLLCDDIHILSAGRLAASGSPLSLKARYGVGYTLTVVMQQQNTPQLQQPKQNQQQQSQQQQQQRQGKSAAKQTARGAAAAPPALQHGIGGGSSTSLCSSSSNSSLSQLQSRVAAVQPQVQALVQLLQQHIPSAQLLSAAGSDVSVRLPKEEAAAFPAALRALDAAAPNLGVSSYGLSVTTLEEVFLAIADQAVAVGPDSSSSPRQQPNRLQRQQQQQQQQLPAVVNGGSAQQAEQQQASSPSSKRQRSRLAAAAAAANGTEAHAAADLARLEEGQGADQQGCSYSQPDLTGASLYWQQFRALFIKRALCARRDRLAVITQLLVPLLLVLLAMVVSTLETSRPQQPPLNMTRHTCLKDQPALFAAAPGLRQQQEVQGFMDGYPRSDLVDTIYTHLYHGSAGPALNLTLEGQLLSQWSNGVPHFDALFLQEMPPIEQLLSSLSGSGPSLTLLVNQSAVSGLPASLNQATSALLRLIVAAGGGKSSPLPSAGTAAAAHSADAGTPGSGSSSSSSSGSSSAGGGHLPSCMPQISTVSLPLPLLLGEKAQRVRQDAGALMLVLCMTLAASVLSASFVVFLVREVDNSSKHLQLVSGARPTAYWLSNFCWDYISFCLPTAGIVLLVFWYHQPQLSGIRLVAMALLLLAFGGAGINLTYLCHFMFVDEMKALQRLNTTYFLTGYLGFLTTWILSLISIIMSKAALGRAAARVKSVLRLLSPHYCFAQGLYDISNTAPGSGALPIPGLPHGPSSPFTYEVLGSAVLHLLAQMLVFGAAAALIDVGIMQLLRRSWASLHRRSSSSRSRGRGQHPTGQGSGFSSNPPPSDPKAQHQPSADAVVGRTVSQPVPGSAALPGTGNGAAAVAAQATQQQQQQQQQVLLSGLLGVDADVATERGAVEAGEGFDEAMVVLDGVSKHYSQGPGLPPVVAVRGLWLRVWPGECFGLLGVNGAGKSTTFRILTGEVTPDSGDAWVSGLSVLTQLASARQRLGYCPQFEALPAAMTGREVLTMYARLRGRAGARSIAAEVQQLLQQLGLTEYADVACGSYSGGNKRKLSVAVALVGNPPLVLLDEPSTGMDPAARRFLWRMLQDQVLSAGRTVILTSHSMEEVDALANRLAIMAAGSARCLGTPQHLKSKFGDGYTLELRVGSHTQPLAGTAGSSTVPGTTDPAAPSAASSGGSHPLPHAGAAAGSAGGMQQASSTTERLAAATAQAEQYFKSAIPGVVLLEKEPGRLLLRLPLGGSNSPQQQRGQQQQAGRPSITSLADVFETVEAARESLAITEYSLAQSSLERVFLSLAKAASHAADGD